MQLTMLGTGHALVTQCYNTCFVLREGNRQFLVDGGGGNGLFSQFRAAGLDWREVKEIFVTHKHIDHLLGILWMLRVICHGMNQETYPDSVTVYAHEEVIGLLRAMAGNLIREQETRFLGNRVELVTVTDGETRTVLGRPTQFFDIHSEKTKQFGFSMALEGGGKLTCCGDEPCHQAAYPYAAHSTWLLHEAYCLHREADQFRPYEKHHSTVRDACTLAEQLGVENLLLYHTEDQHLSERKALYTAEGRGFFHGNLYVPDDLETLTIL